ncbi:trace amine-associated receptor 4-like [Pelobates fuscus]|uniref:trace amine-associated receptor 4-like n=1 Tax=Pelobates fuscus TaxID=191477 RepID=UPI002FE4758F
MNSSVSGNKLNSMYCFDLSNSCPKTNVTPSRFSAMCIIMSVIITITIVGNLMVIISVSHFKQLHSPTNFLILSLAITDFLLGLVIMPYSMVRSATSCWYFGDLFCKLHSCLDMTFCTTSILHLFFISVDRYYAVCQPLHYYSKITNRMIEVYLFVSWSVPFLYSVSLIVSNVHMEGLNHFVESHTCIGSCFLILNKLWATVSSSFCFFVPGAMMIGIYIHIFSVAQKQARMLVLHNHPHYLGTNTNKASLKVESKAAKTLSLVMGAFLLCWLPFSIVTVVDPYLDFTTSDDLYNAVLWLGYFNSSLNPIIYALFYPWFQKTFKIIITGKLFNNDFSSFCVR